MLAVEADADAHARVVFHAVPLLAALVLFLLRPLIRFALDDQPASPGGDQLLEDHREFPTHLLERPLDGLVLALIQHRDQFLDARLAAVQLFSPFLQRVPLGGEVVVLLKGLLVHVPVLLERFVDLVQALDDGFGFGGRVFGFGVGGEDAEVADAGVDFGGLGGEDAAFLDRFLHALLLALDRFGDFGLGC